MDASSFIVLIPARYESSRFPGKPLVNIMGQSLIQRVYQNCLESGGKVCVVTNHPLIQEHVKSFGGEVCRVDDPVESGTERVFLAYQRFFAHDRNIKLIVNVQGDEPLLPGAEIRNLSDFHLGHNFDIGTMVKKRLITSASHGDLGFADIKSSQVVKVIYSEKSQKCHYFSRAPIPFSREGLSQLSKNDCPYPVSWHQHVGVYSYTPQALEFFFSTGPSYYEDQEKLEQLRALEAGMDIRAVMVDKNLVLHGVDVPEDVQKIEGAISGKK